jgi:hypothetical protein
MSVTIAKRNLQKVVDSIENETVLNALLDYAEAIQGRQSSTGRIWDLLPDDEKEAVLAAESEAMDPKNWIPHEVVLKRL